MNLDNAAIVHAQWKAKFRVAIANADSMDSTAIGRDDCCELGKWIHGEAKMQLGTTPEFTALMDKHKAFHVEAGKVANAINAKLFEDAFRMTEAFTPFGSASATVSLAINALKNAMR